jgi:hypothetical protein
MAEPKKERIRIRVIRIKDTDDDKAIYAKALKAFTAADLQKYTEIEPGIPAEQVLAEMEAIDREETEKRKQREAKRKQREEMKKRKQRAETKKRKRKKA